jgi:hypothetical protein
MCASASACGNAVFVQRSFAHQPVFVQKVQKVQQVKFVQVHQPIVQLRVGGQVRLVPVRNIVRRNVQFLPIRLGIVH